MSAIQPTGVNAYAQHGIKPVPSKNTSETTANTQPLPSALNAEKSSVTLSEEGKALLAALQEIDAQEKTTKENEPVSKSVESFAHGALGIDHPDEIEEAEDDSYSAGQYLSGALSAASLLLAII